MSSVLSPVTVLSLALVAALLAAAYLLSLQHLPAGATRTRRTLYIWHLFDALIHLLLEGSFVYHSFASSAAGGGGGRHATVPRLWGSPRSYGAKHSSAPTARLWQEYARADRRWEEADVTVLSLEILTVVVGGPLAAYVAVLVARARSPRDARKAWWWMALLATAEIYGGWMTFCPEWISGNAGIAHARRDWMLFWVYLVFFNGLWVVVPGWVLYRAYRVLVAGERDVLVGAAGKRE